MNLLDNLEMHGNETLRTFIQRLTARQGIWESKWFSNHQIEVYIRAGDQFSQRLGIHKSVVFSTINVQQQYQHQGIFKSLLAQTEEFARSLQCGSVKVECVHNQLLLDYLLKNGYVHENAHDAPTVIKLLPRE